MTCAGPLLLVHHNHQHIGWTESAAAGGGRFGVHGLGGYVAEDIDYLYARLFEPIVDFTFKAADFGFDTFEDLDLLHEVTPDSFSPNRKGRYIGVANGS